MNPLKLAVIIGSTREGRAGDGIGRWFVDEAKQRPDLEITVVDLADYDFPARFPGSPTPAMRAFVAEIRRADAFVVVTPEYNHSFPASLKQAVDFAYDEWHAKPVGYVSYGSGSVGAHAVDQLRTVFTALHAVSMRDAVGIDLLHCDLDADQLRQDASVLLDQLGWWGLTLRDGRAARPYVS
jgi:NAD(P)H-dependent FMN reductase